MFHPLDGCFISKNFTTILLQLYENLVDNSWLFFGPSLWWFLTGPLRPPDRVTPGGVVSVQTIVVPAKDFLRFGDGTVITLLNARVPLITWVNTHTKHGRLFGYSYQYAVVCSPLITGLWWDFSSFEDWRSQLDLVFKITRKDI